MGNSCCHNLNVDQLEQSTNFDNNDRFSEILEYHDKIALMHEVWETDIEEEGLKVLTKDGSTFDEGLPVLWVQITFDRLIPLDFIESLLVSENRMVWDKANILDMQTLSTDEIENTYVTYQLQKFPWPMQNRDFVEAKKRT